MEGTIVGKNYRILEKIGNGAFGEIWKVVNIINNKQYAAKFEEVETKSQQLYSECRMYLWFHTDHSIGNQAIPQVVYYGLETNKSVMILDLLGPSLETLFNKCNKKFSLKTVLMIAIQMIKRIEYVHSRRIIHRDVKPDNFTVGLDKNKHMIYIIDFGLAKKYMDSTGEHIKYREGKGLTGTARYASVNTHMGIEQSRRDDLESIGYVLIYFLKGTLPWQNLKARNTKEKYEKIKEKKITTKIEDLCKGLPKEFFEYCSYCRKVKFAEKPDYAFLISLFKDMMKRMGIEEDYKFDWESDESKNSKDK